MQPVATKYQGIEFRSRLEARWAVLFDNLNITWRYEDEAYETSTGKYLPDFWLPDVYLRDEKHKGVLFEVKPETYTNGAHAQLEEVANKLGVSAILAQGFKCDRGNWDELYQIAPWWDNQMLIYPCPNGHVKFEFSEGSYMHCVHDNCIKPAHIERGKFEYHMPMEAVQKAYKAAISFRFW